MARVLREWRYTSKLQLCSKGFLCFVKCVQTSQIKNIQKKKKKHSKLLSKFSSPVYVFVCWILKVKVVLVQCW